MIMSKQNETNKVTKEMEVANPIYDIVFKYLMEDERVARTILSALLKKEVVDVEVRPHEYANDQRDTLSVFRIDFGATIRNADGTEHLILVELQKTWLETETLRFRQYLGVQYQSERNVTADGYGLPMVAVYLLGHKVGDIDEPVVYVHHEPLDYDGNLVTKGIPDPFVSSLTHDSIIVQIPHLSGKIRNRLDQVMAAASSDIRQDMNVEDEYYSYLEQKETEVLMKDKIIAQKEAQLSQKEAQLSKSIKMLLGAGLSIEKVAENLGVDTETVKSILDSNAQ